MPLPYGLPQGLPHCCWIPNRGWVPLGVGTPPIPQPPVRGAGLRSGLYFCSPFPPSYSLRTPVAGGGLGGQRIRPRISAASWGPKWAGETWLCSLLILCPPSGSPISPFGRGIPSLPPPSPQGHQSRPASPSPPPSSPHALPSLWGVPSLPLGVRGPPLLPGRCPSCAEARILHPHSPPS